MKCLSLELFFPVGLFVFVLLICSGFAKIQILCHIFGIFKEQNVLFSDFSLEGSIKKYHIFVLPTEFTGSAVFFFLHTNM